MRERARPTPSSPSPAAGERIDKAAEEKNGKNGDIEGQNGRSKTRRRENGGRIQWKD